MASSTVLGDFLRARRAGLTPEAVGITTSFGMRRVHEVAPRTWGVKVLHPPLVGDLELEWSALTWNADPDMQVVAWTAVPGTASYQRLVRLRALTAPKNS